MDGKIIQGLDIFDVIYLIGKKNKKFQAILLQDLEEVVDKDSEQYLKIRKLVLDSYNNYTRSVLRAVFGNDFEYISK